MTNNFSAKQNREKTTINFYAVLFFALVLLVEHKFIYDSVISLFFFCLHLTLKFVSNVIYMVIFYVVCGKRDHKTPHHPQLITSFV